MAITLSIKAELIGAAEASGGAEAVAARARDLSRPLERLGQHHVRKAARTLRAGTAGIRSRQGSLAASLTYEVGPRNSLAIGSNLSYALSQQYGPPGGIYQSSRPGGFLAIPIADNIAARQQARFNSPRDVPDGFFLRTEKHLLFVRERARARKPPRPKGKSRFHQAMSGAAEALRRTLDVLFVLLKSVKGEAHHYARHEQADEAAWANFARQWILQGK